MTRNRSVPAGVPAPSLAMMLTLALAFVLAVLPRGTMAEPLTAAEAAPLGLCTDPYPDHGARVAGFEAAGWRVLPVGARDAAVARIAAGQAPLLVLTGEAPDLAAATDLRTRQLAFQAAVQDFDGIPTDWLVGGEAGAPSFVLLETTRNGASCSIVPGRPFALDELHALVGGDVQSRDLGETDLVRLVAPDGAILMNALFPDQATGAPTGPSDRPTYLMTPLGPAGEGAP